ncbi:MAG: electron transfer flavoprotein subunit beta/FixA family protein [Chloroflexota bacterium]
MKIVVLAKLVPDLVEELEINDEGTALDLTWLRLKLNEFDDHAIEQAVLLKERSGAHITLIVPDMEGADDVLFTAAAKGFDRLVKLSGDFEADLNNHALARAFASILKGELPDLVLTGVQAHNDLDGSLGALLAGYLDLPYVGYISGVNANGGSALVRKEYPGGLIAEMEVTLPAVLGIQAAESPPSYVAFSKIRQAMKTAVIDDKQTPLLDSHGGAVVKRMFVPESGERASMLEGSLEEIAGKLTGIFQNLGLL